MNRSLRLPRRPLADESSDAAIIAESIEEPDRFGEIFERHHRAVLAYLMRRIGREPAEHVCADVFVTAFQIRERYEPRHGTAFPWLCGIAAHKVHHHRRREATHDRITASLDLRAVHADDTTDTIDLRVDSQRLRPSLRRGLATLSDDDRETLLLHLWAGLSYAEVATALDIPTGTVRSRINRAKRHLRSAVLPDAASFPDGEVI